jgi:hypothetical protein
MMAGTLGMQLHGSSACPAQQHAKAEEQAPKADGCTAEQERRFLRNNFY